MTGNFNNMESDIRKASVVKERVNLISSHMYKQYLDHQMACENTKEMFYLILKEMDSVIDYLKESFSARTISSSNISYEFYKESCIAVINILWNSITFKTRNNTRPQALARENYPPLFSGRIIALNGNFKNPIITNEDFTSTLKNEIASLYIPADKTANCIIKIKHLANKEFIINPIDAPREFLLKVIEIICGGGIYHEEDFIVDHDF